MTLFGIPFEQSSIGVRGAAAGVAIPAGSIRTTDTLLAIIKHRAATGEIAGLDPAAFTVADGEVQSATLDTSGFYLHVLYTGQG